MVGPDQKRSTDTLQTVSPFLKSQFDCQQLSFPGIVFLFSSLVQSLVQSSVQTQRDVMNLRRRLSSALNICVLVCYCVLFPIHKETRPRTDMVPGFCSRPSLFKQPASEETCLLSRLIACPSMHRESSSFQARTHRVQRNKLKVLFSVSVVLQKYILR